MPRRLTKRREYGKIIYMDNNLYYGIIPLTFVALMIAWGICLLFGKLSILVPGYNEKAKNDNAKFFEKAFCKRVGIFLLILSVLASGVFSGLIFHIIPLVAVMGVLVAVYIATWFILVANGTKMKRLLYLTRELEKTPDGLPQEEIERWKRELAPIGKTKKQSE